MEFVHFIYQKSEALCSFIECIILHNNPGIVTQMYAFANPIYYSDNCQTQFKKFREPLSHGPWQTQWLSRIVGKYVKISIFVRSCVMRELNCISASDERKSFYRYARNNEFDEKWNSITQVRTMGARHTVLYREKKKYMLFPLCVAGSGRIRQMHTKVNTFCARTIQTHKYNSQREWQSKQKSNRNPIWRC